MRCSGNKDHVGAKEFDGNEFCAECGLWLRSVARKDRVPLLRPVPPRPGKKQGAGENELFTDSGLSSEALYMIASEDVAQREKWGSQSRSLAKWCLILGEEVGELNKAILEYLAGNETLTRIVREAVQVSTLALKIAWMCRRQLKKARE